MFLAGSARAAATAAYNSATAAAAVAMNEFGIELSLIVNLVQPYG